MFRKIAAIALAFGSVVAVAGCSSDNSSLVMVGIPLDADQEVEARYLILMDMISESTGRDVTFLKANDYATAVESLNSGRADIGVLDPMSYVLATKRDADLNLVAVGAREQGVEPAYFSYGIAGAGDDSITEIADLAGKKICISDPSSLASYLMPAASFKKAGFVMDVLTRVDAEVIAVGAMPQVAVSVANGDCDAGFLVDSFYDVVVPKSGLVDMSSLKKFWTSDPFSSIALVAGKKLSANEIGLVQARLLELGNKPALIGAGICTDIESCMFMSSSTWGLVPGNDSSYDSVRDVCAILELESCN
jgi:phosphonate transport system substrate-binding protein